MQSLIFVPGWRDHDCISTKEKAIDGQTAELLDLVIMTGYYDQEQ